MIKKLKTKFILLSMSSLLILLTVLIVCMNLVNYGAVTREADEILALLSQNDGRFPEFSHFPDEGKGNRFPPQMSPELPYESRYFSVVLTENGQLLYTDVSKIASVDAESAAEYGRKVLSQKDERGFADRFRFLQTEENGAVRITFLDCGRQLDAYQTFLLVSIGIALGGFAAVFGVIVFCSGHIIRPIAESYEKQKQFITDAGHEIKTPLTVIRANVDLLEMDLGENDMLSDIRQQTKRLSSLTNDLVYLSRMEEANRPLPKIEFPVSEVVTDTALAFRAPLAACGKELSCEVEPLLSMLGNSNAMEQLVSLLLDNALKYAKENSEIRLRLYRHGKTLHLVVSNLTEQPIQKEQLSQIFDRFYRTDPSRNSATGGHGIGLSVAKAIVTAHGGRITATVENDDQFTITASFPQ